MKMKRFLAGGLALAMLTSGAVFAEEAETDKSKFVTFDLTQLGANAILFDEADKGATGEDGIEAVEKTILTWKGSYKEAGKYFSATPTSKYKWDSTQNQYVQSNAIEKYDIVSYILNKTAFDNAKNTDGNIEADLTNGVKIPFNIKTETDKVNAFFLGGPDHKGGDNTKSTTLDIEDAQYSEIYFPVMSGNNPELNAYVVYTDGTNNKGTTESVQRVYDFTGNKNQSKYTTTSEDGKGKPVAGWINKFGNDGGYKENDLIHTAMLFKINCEIKQEGTTVAHGQLEQTTPLNASYYVPVYSITVDPTKIVDKIEFSGASRYNQAAILAVTGVKARENSVKDYALNALKDAVENDAADWAAAYRYIKAAETMNQSGWTETEKVIYNQAKAKYNEVTRNAETIDISGSYTAKVYAEKGTKVDGWSTAGNYLNKKTDNSGNWSTDRALNKTEIENIKEKQGGVIHTTQGKIPFDINTTGGIILGGMGAGDTGYKTINVNAEQEFSKLAVLYGDSYHVNNYTIKVKLNYKDGTSEDRDFKFAEETESFVLTNGKITKEDGSAAANVTLYVKEIEADPTKMLANVQVKHDGNYTCVEFIALTGIPATAEDEKAYFMEKLNIANTATDVDWAETNKYIKLAESFTAAGNELTAEEQVVLDSVKDKYYIATGKAKTIDISESFTEGFKLYANPNEKLSDWTTAGVYFSGRTRTVTETGNIDTDSNQHALNRAVVESSKNSQGGVIHSNNVPFDVKTTGAVRIGNPKSDTWYNIKINADRRYEKLAFLMDYSTDRDVSVKVKYTDGTTGDEIKFNTKDFNKKTALQDLHIIDGDGKVETRPAGYERGLYEYEIAVNSKKMIESIDVKYSDTWTGAVILAITGVGEQELSNIDKLNAYEAKAKAGTITAEELEAAYQMFRTEFGADQSEYVSSYSSILALKAKSGVVTINDYVVDGKKITVNLDSVSEEGYEDSVVAYAAIYDDNGLVEVQLQDFESIIMGAEEGQTAEFTFTNDISGKTVKCFVWNSAQTPVAGVLVK